MATAVCGRLETSNPVRVLRPTRNRRCNGIRRRPIPVDRRGSSPDYVGQASRRYRFGERFQIPQSAIRISRLRSWRFTFEVMWTYRFGKPFQIPQSAIRDPHFLHLSKR